MRYFADTIRSFIRLHIGVSRQKDSHKLTNFVDPQLTESFGYSIRKLVSTGLRYDVAVSFDTAYISFVLCIHMSSEYLSDNHTE